MLLPTGQGGALYNATSGFPVGLITGVVPVMRVRTGVCMVPVAISWVDVFKAVT